MDFWLLVGRLVRRWYLTLPLAAVALVVAAGASESVANSYAIDTQVLLVPAGSAPEIDPATGAPVARAANPLLAANRNQLDAATQSVSFVLDSPSAEAERTAAAPGASVSFSLVEEAPIIVVRVTGADPDTVADGADIAVDQLADVLVGIEEPLGADPSTRIETVQLSEPTLVEEVGDRRRVLVGALVAGLLAVGLVVLAVDHALRRHLERRLSADLDEQAERLARSAGGSGSGAHQRN